MQVAIRITENDGPARAMHFDAPAVLLVGRHSDCDLRLEGDLVSRKHARVMLGSASFIVEDLSANGTEILPNQKLHGERRELEYGSQLRIGPFALTVGDVPVPVHSRPPPLPRRTAPPLPGAAAAAFIPRAPATPGSSFPPPPPLPSAPAPVSPLGAVPTPHAFSPLAQSVVSPPPPPVPPPLPRPLEPTLTPEVVDRSPLALFAPVRALLDDPSVTVVMIDGPVHVSVERRGKLEKTDARFPSPRALMAALRAAAEALPSPGRPFDEAHPILDARFADGTRLTAVLAPPGRGGPYVTLRRRSRERFGLERLVSEGALHEGAASLLRGYVATGHNVIVGGAAGSGKTTLLEALAAQIPEGERVILLEDVAELDLPREEVVTFETSPHATLRQLLTAALAMRPDRIIVGELQGPEALDLVTSMTRGRGGFLATLRGGSPGEAIARLEALTGLADATSSQPARRAVIAAAVQVVVGVARMRDGTRKVTHVTEVALDTVESALSLRDLYVRTVQGGQAEGAVRSTLAPTGLLPGRLEDLRAWGYDLPREMADAAARSPATDSADRRP